MGFRFKKSKQIAPGVRVNLNKKSASVTFGSNGVHHTINSSGKKTTSAGIPGSGLYYTSSSGGGGGSRNNDNFSDSFIPDGGGGSAAPKPDKNSNGNKTDFKTKLFYSIIAVIIIAICKFLTIFASIIAIPLFIYFYRHKEKERRKLYLFFTGLAFISGFALSLPPDIDTISVKSNKNIVLDINSSKKISYTIDPEDGDRDELKIISSKSGIISTNLKDHSFTIKSGSKTGSTTVYLQDGDVGAESKKIKVTVEDKKAIAESKKKAEEEKKRKEEERKKKEQARIAAEKKEKEAAKATESTKEKEEMVWVSNTGSKYHSSSTCSNMKNPVQRTLSYAKSRGLTPCSKCH